MPRRYGRYRDIYSLWNKLSSTGRLISFGATLFFIFVFWEIIIVNRLVINFNRLNVFLESSFCLPLPPHSFNQRVFCSSKF
jgi:hypothetical protein